MSKCIAVTDLNLDDITLAIYKPTIPAAKKTDTVQLVLCYKGVPLNKDTKFQFGSQAAPLACWGGLQYFDTAQKKFPTVQSSADLGCFAAVAPSQKGKTCNLRVDLRLTDDASGQAAINFWNRIEQLHMDAYMRGIDGAEVLPNLVDKPLDKRKDMLEALDGNYYYRLPFRPAQFDATNNRKYNPTMTMKVRAFLNTNAVRMTTPGLTVFINGTPATDPVEALAKPLHGRWAVCFDGPYGKCPDQKYHPPCNLFAALVCPIVRNPATIDMFNAELSSSE
jgi:hypothetical protein